MAFYDPRVFEFHVLLVDSDFDALVQTATAIQSNSYKVTSVQDASTASEMLSDVNMSFDLVMVDVSSTTLEGFKLVHEAIDLGYTVIIMSNKANATLVKSAIEDGAFLFMERSTAAQELKYIWQHLLREKTRRNNKGKAPMYGEASTSNNLGMMNTNQYMSSMNYNDNIIRFGRGRSAEPAIYNTNSDTINNISSNNNNKNNINASDGYIRPKMCTEWTPELHEKFMDAVRQLGDGRCFPKDILELMNVPGLTRLQVASHLQKCRHTWNQWPDERPTRRSKSLSSSSSKTTRKYGLFPRLATGAQSSLQVPPRDNQNDETAPNDNMELYSTPSISIGTIANLEQVLTDDIIDNNANGTMNEIINIDSGENDVVLGDIAAAVDGSFDFAVSDDCLIIANSFDLQNSDSDNTTVSDQTSLVANQDKEFLESWISEFASENRDC